MSVESTAIVTHPGRMALHWERLPQTMQAAPYGALTLRLMLAWFFWSHLFHKLVTPGSFAGWWASLAHDFAPYVPLYVFSVELAGSILLPLGFRTRWVALWAVPAFVGIIYTWYQRGGYAFSHPGAEFPIMWLCLLVLQIIFGDGAFALKWRRGGAAVT